MKFGLNERPLAAQLSDPVIQKLKTLVIYPKDIGIAQFDVDASNYSLESQNCPPDRTGLAALKREHEAVAYDTGFREQIEASIDNT